MDKLVRPVQVLLTVEEADRLMAQAKVDGRTVSAWCRRVLVREIAAATVSLDAPPPPGSSPQARPF